MAKVDESLGEELRQRRRAKGYTQDSLAAKLRVAEKTVGKWERYEVMPSATNIRALERLGLIEEWVGRNGSTEDRQSPARQPNDPVMLALGYPRSELHLRVSEIQDDVERELLAIFRRFSVEEQGVILNFFCLVVARAEPTG